jgi:hypothetical protein
VPRLGIRFDPQAFAVLRKFGLRGPLWQHLDRVPTRKFASPGTGSGDTAATSITSA